MIGYFIVQTWNGNRTVFKNSISEDDIANAVMRREAIIDMVKRMYYDVDLKRWVHVMQQ